MFTEERLDAITRALQEKGKVRVKELSEQFHVTEDCIRKDLKALENAGKLKRTYGGAILQRLFSFPRPAPEVDPGIFNQRRSFEQPFQGCSFFVCEPHVF